MTTALARRFKIDVSTDGTTWVPFKGVNDFNPAETPTIQSADDYDSNGFAGFEKTLTGAKLTIKARRVLNAGALDPGQELVRATAYKFDTNARVYVRWYDRNGLSEAYSGYFLADWQRAKTGVADLEEITVTLTADGVVSSISNPYNAPAVPVITAATPASVAAGSLLTISGAYFTGASKVVQDGLNMTNYTVVSDSSIVATMPTALVAPAAPAPTTAATGGTVLAGVYQVVVTYVNANGESIASVSGSVTTTGSTSTLTVPSPGANAAATGWYAYVSQAGGTAAAATRQQAAGSPTAVGTALTLTAPPTTTGITPPSKAGLLVTNGAGTSAPFAYTRG